MMFIRKRVSCIKENLCEEQLTLGIKSNIACSIAEYQQSCIVLHSQNTMLYIKTVTVVNTTVHIPCHIYVCVCGSSHRIFIIRS